MNLRMSAQQTRTAIRAIAPLCRDSKNSSSRLSFDGTVWSASPSTKSVLIRNSQMSNLAMIRVDCSTYSDCGEFCLGLDVNGLIEDLSQDIDLIIIENQNSVSLSTEPATDSWIKKPVVSKVYPAIKRDLIKDISRSRCANFLKSKPLSIATALLNIEPEKGRKNMGSVEVTVKNNSTSPVLEFFGNRTSTRWILPGGAEENNQPFRFTKKVDYRLFSSMISAISLVSNTVFVGMKGDDPHVFLVSEVPNGTIPKFYGLVLSEV